VTRLGDLGFKRWSSDVQKQTRHGTWRTGAETETEMGSESLMVVFSFFFFFLPPEEKGGGLSSDWACWRWLAATVVVDGEVIREERKRDVITLRVC
jgi:hypothetical protein